MDAKSKETNLGDHGYLTRALSKFRHRAKHLVNTSQHFGALMAVNGSKERVRSANTVIASQTHVFRVWPVYLRRSAMIPAL
jgi:isoaspartyl peptidase/L-asparaginase-like protein (Ntn-hydrolase superfamily)